MLPRLYIPEGGTSLEEVEHAMVELAMHQANARSQVTGHQPRCSALLAEEVRARARRRGRIGAS
jgi:hypothetical protein